MKKVYYTWQDVEGQTQELLRQMQVDNWRPDYVVGLTRGGLVPANLISQYLGCRMETLKVKLRDNLLGEVCESNCWMAEDAFGYVPTEERGDSGTRWDPARRKNILIVDDINDSGATLNWIKQDWQSGCLPSESAWNTVWGNNVRVAVLVDNESSDAIIDVKYSAVNINKAAEDQWIVYPWEDWWQR